MCGTSKKKKQGAAQVQIQQFAEFWGSDFYFEKVQIFRGEGGGQP